MRKACDHIFSTNEFPFALLKYTNGKYANLVAEFFSLSYGLEEHSIKLNHYRLLLRNIFGDKLHT